MSSMSNVIKQQLSVYSTGSANSIQYSSAVTTVTQLTDFHSQML